MNEMLLIVPFGHTLIICGLVIVWIGVITIDLGCEYRSLLKLTVGTIWVVIGMVMIIYGIRMEVILW